jgi:hypothetical protein
MLPRSDRCSSSEENAMKRPFAHATLVALSLSIAGPASAAPASVVALRAFRVQMASLLDRYDAVLDALDNQAGRARVAEARAAMANVADQDLATAFSWAGVPDLRPAVVAAEGLLAITPRPTPPTAPTKLLPALAQALVDLPGSPPILGSCDNIRHDSAWVFGALVAWQVARGILAAAEFGCEEVVVVLGEGGNAAAACIPLAIAAEAAAIPYELGSFCAGEEDSATLQGTYLRVAAVHEELREVRDDIIADAAANRDAILAAVAASRDTIIANDDANRDLIIANDDKNRYLIMKDAHHNKEKILHELREVSCDLARLITKAEGKRHPKMDECRDYGDGRGDDRGDDRGK